MSQVERASPTMGYVQLRAAELASRLRRHLSAALRHQTSASLFRSICRRFALPADPFRLAIRKNPCSAGSTLVPMSMQCRAAMLVLVVLLVGCTTTREEDPSAASAVSEARKSAGAAAGGATNGLLPQPELDDEIQVGATYDYVVGTHCGVWFIGLDGDNWVTPTPLSDNGTTPSGWNLGGQRGRLEIVSSTKAIFRDSKGHVVVFERQKNTQPMGCA